MSKWINLFLENEIVNRSDKSDKFKFETNMSPLSLHPQGLLDEKMEKVENNHSKGGDKSDRFKLEPNMSPLSLRLQGLLDEKMVNTPESDISDKSGRSDPNLNLSGLSGPSLRESFEERLAIVEHDGDQTPLHAHHIAYLDAFISVLTALPATGPRRDWLDQKIQTSLAWIEAQNFPTLN